VLLNQQFKNTIKFIVSRWSHNPEITSSLIPTSLQRFTKQVASPPSSIQEHHSSFYDRVIKRSQSCDRWSHSAHHVRDLLCVFLTISNSPRSVSHQFATAQEIKKLLLLLQFTPKFKQAQSRILDLLSWDRFQARWPPNLRRVVGYWPRHVLYSLCP
jgi:hypothetical protein